MDLQDAVLMPYTNKSPKFPGLINDVKLLAYCIGILPGIPPAKLVTVLINSAEAPALPTNPVAPWVPVLPV